MKSVDLYNTFMERDRSYYNILENYFMKHGRPSLSREDDHTLNNDFYIEMDEWVTQRFNCTVNYVPADFSSDADGVDSDGEYELIFANDEDYTVFVLEVL